MTKVNFYDSIDDSMLKFAVIIAKHNGKWVFCKHRERSTWASPQTWVLAMKNPRILRGLRRFYRNDQDH